MEQRESLHIKRFWEVDLLRGVAVVLMITYHLFFDLAYFNIYHINGGALFWTWFPRFIVFLFLFLAGLSLTLSFSRNKKDTCIKPYIKRGLRIFSLGMLITLASRAFAGDGTILFGILHLIGVSVIFAYPFLSYRRLNIIAGIMAVSAGFYLSTRSFDFPYLLWLGFIPRGFTSLDYEPILPWFGVILFGIYFGNTYYQGYTRKFRIPEFCARLPIQHLCLLGKNSLKVYLLHQPTLIGILYILSFILPIPSFEYL